MIGRASSRSGTSRCAIARRRGSTPRTSRAITTRAHRRAAGARTSSCSACVPAAYGGLRERVELRDLCVLRAVLGYRSSLADTMFAMQGLGSYPVMLAGSDAQKRGAAAARGRGRAHLRVRHHRARGRQRRRRASRRARVRDGDGWRPRRRRRASSPTPASPTPTCVFARTSRRAPPRHQRLPRRRRRPRADALTPIELIAPHPIGTRRRSPACACPASRCSARRATASRSPWHARLLPHLGRRRRGRHGRARARRGASRACRRAGSSASALAEFQATQLALAEMAVDSTPRACSSSRRRTASTPSERPGDRRGGDGQAVRDRGGAARDRSRGAALRRPRRGRRRDGRAAVPRDPRAAHLRGHQRDPEARHRQGAAPRA